MDSVMDTVFYVLRKVVSKPEKGILGRDQRFFAVVLVQMDVGIVDMWKM